MEPLPVPNWRRFHDIWKKHLPTIRIRYACEDTCPGCFILKNKFRYLGRRRNNNDEAATIVNNEELPEDVVADESLLFDANLHAEQAQQQRNLASKHQNVAIEEFSNAHED
jgi:hypothetical protein